jgi:hypothetical protein
MKSGSFASKVERTKKERQAKGSRSVDPLNTERLTAFQAVNVVKA